MSTFFNKIAEINTKDSTHQQNNPHAMPTPVDVREIYLLAADGLQHIMSDAVNERHSEFLEAMIRDLHLGAEQAQEIKGVSQEFIDGLDRVPKKTLKKTDICPICAEPFLDDEYPLVVQLPCHPSHRFDLECIAPWLKLQGTCPLDRKELQKKKQVVIPVDEEEDDYDDMIA
jgi:Ring finger domain